MADRRLRAPLGAEWRRQKCSTTYLHPSHALSLLMKTRYKIEFVNYLVIRLIMLCPCLMETRYKIHLIMLCLQPLPKLFRFNI